MPRGQGGHRFTPEEAQEAGRAGGTAAQQSGRAHKLSKEERSKGGRIGGSR